MSRKIPETWFRASPVNSTMAFVKDAPHKRRFAPLADGERQLGWFVLPNFQRPAVWTEAQQIRFVESCWMGLPIGAFVYNRTNDMHSPYDAWLLDGQQRITSLIRYMDDAFPVLGHLFSELTDHDYRKWEMSVSCPCMETKIEDEDQLREIYDRLAYGGTPHEPKENNDE